jgi:hypothetical protein
MITAANGFVEQSTRYSTDNTGSSLANYTLIYKIVEWKVRINHLPHSSVYQEIVIPL